MPATPDRDGPAWVIFPAAVMLVAGVLAGCGPASPDASSTRPAAGQAAHTAAAGAARNPAAAPAQDTPSVSPLPQLPRGGRTILPRYRVVAYYGAGVSTALGVLGRGSPDEAATRLQRQADAYAGFGRPVLPCMELITTVATAFPGPGGTYSSRTSADVVQRYLDAARRHKMILMLDFQPGRGDFLRQVSAYDRFLAQPDVSVALDPEWKMTGNQVPGKVIGHTTAHDVNAVVDHVAALVKRDRLPQKLFVIHQFTGFMVSHRSAVRTPPGLAVTFHIDGFGGQRVKIDKYHVLAPKPPYFRAFKLFYKADTDLMTPRQAMALRPRPDLVSYQ